jgi:hypothetical protein
MMQQQQPQGQQQPIPRRDAGAMSMGGMGGMGALGGMGGMGGMGGLGGLGGAGGPGDGDGAAAIEISPEQVRAIRRMVAENVTLMGPLVESLKQTDPERAAHLTPTDPDGILRFFEELGNDDDVPSGSGGGTIPRIPPAAPALGLRGAATSPPAAQNVTLTPAEHASIQNVRLFTFPFFFFQSWLLLISCSFILLFSWKRWAIRGMLCSRHSSRVEGTRNRLLTYLLKVRSTKTEY